MAAEIRVSFVARCMLARRPPVPGVTSAGLPDVPLSGILLTSLLGTSSRPGAFYQDCDITTKPPRRGAPRHMERAGHAKERPMPSAGSNTDTLLLVSGRLRNDVCRWTFTLY